MSVAEAVLEGILKATRPEEVFGYDAGQDDVTRTYKNLVREVHPDRGGSHEAAAKLNALYDAAKERFAASTYGQPSTVTLTTKRYAFEVGELIARGDVSNVYRGTYSDPRKSVDVSQDCVVKIAREPASSGMLENEAKAIKQIISDKDIFDAGYAYFPTIIQSFKFKSGSTQRRANAYSFLPELYNLRQVRDVYQRGVHAKDMAWMFRRILIALAFAHARGVVHGAILPEHVLIQPEMHGLVLVDWKAASLDESPIPFIAKNRREWYPERLLEKKPARPEFDIYMATKCMEYVCGGADTLPQWLRAFFKGCRSSRLPDAFDLRDEFDALIESKWGPRTFRPFALR